MQRFFVEPHQIDEGAHQIHILGSDVNHISNVLRMKQGEELWISDGGKKEYRCTIEEFSPDEVLLHIIYAQQPDYELQSRIYLFQGLPKADKMELIIQKAVELGAYEVIPVETKRCVVKLDGKKAAKKVAATCASAIPTPFTARWISRRCSSPRATAWPATWSACGRSSRACTSSSS